MSLVFLSPLNKVPNCFRLTKNSKAKMRNCVFYQTTETIVVGNRACQIAVFPGVPQRSAIGTLFYLLYTSDSLMLSKVIR